METVLLFSLFKILKERADLEEKVVFLGVHCTVPIINL